MTHLVEIRLDPARLAVWANNLGIAHAETDYVVHSALCAAYGDLRPRPFVLKPGGRTIRLLGYSSPDGAELHAMRTATAEPEIDSCFLSEASKRMPDEWKPGATFGFELRVAPTRQRSGRGGEVDAMSMAPEGRGREEVYGDWLDSRLSGAGQIVSIAMSRFGKAAVRRRSTRDDGSRRLGTIISLPDVTFTGLIRVVESDGFANLIANGIGRHKAFGFGAMLLRPCVS